MRYNLKLTKILEDGTEVPVTNLNNEPGWYISPWLTHLAKQTFEPKPKQTLPGEVPMFNMKPGKARGRAA